MRTSAHLPRRLRKEEKKTLIRSALWLHCRRPPKLANHFLSKNGESMFDLTPAFVFNASSS